MAREKPAPRYDGCKPATASASEAKRQNRAEGTKPELALRRALWAKGLRYRLHPTDLPGKPDIVFRGRRIVLFVDGDFWHGRNWVQRKAKLRRGSNAEYWVAKIEYNIERDQRNRRLLEDQGWTVIRIWESELSKDLVGVVDRITARLGPSLPPQRTPETSHRA